MTRSMARNLPEGPDDPELCRRDPVLHTGPDLFEIESAAARNNRENEAKSVCRRCPVREDCLRHALAELPSHGVWGGHTVGELVRLSESARTRSLTDAA